MCEYIGCFHSRSQATTWQLITFSGSKPSGRWKHAAAWSIAADGLYIHGGSDGISAGAQEVGRVADWRLRGLSDELWFFSRQAGFGDGAGTYSCREALSWTCKDHADKVGISGLSSVVNAFRQTPALYRRNSKTLVLFGKCQYVEQCSFVLFALLFSGSSRVGNLMCLPVFLKGGRGN